MKSIYLTTPIYYVNAEPHLGHASTIILLDVLARYYRQRGVATRSLTGTDEHGEKIAKAAAREGITPQAFTDRVSALFRNAWPPLQVEVDDFIRTTEPRHKEVVARILTQLWEAGEIYKGNYEGLYCVGCERYLTEKELVDGNCADHGTPPSQVVEENYMFRMEKHREWLRETLIANPELIVPDRYRQEVLAILREPIGDLSISRPRTRVPWGQAIPWDPEHVVYVWFDALLNYVSALGGPGAELFEKYWTETRHLLGKDIVKQHGIFWPIMLKSAGLPLFKSLYVHGWWLVDSAKMSKSLDNAVRPHVMIEKFGSDAFRYFLSRDIVFGNDADFSEVALAKRLNSDLANDLGNLVNRVATMISRYCGGKIPAPGPEGELERGLREIMEGVPDRFDRHVERVQLGAAIEEVLQGVRKANQYLQESAPWKLAKDEASSEALGTVLYTAAETLRLAAVLLYPVIPAKAVELLGILGCEETAPCESPAWKRAWGHLPVGLEVVAGQILFPKFDVAALEKKIVAEREGASAGDGARKAKKNGAPSDSGARKAEETGVSKQGDSAGEGAAPEFITIDDFKKVELKVAKVVAVEPVKKAKRLLKLSLEVGETTRTVVSGIAEHYTAEELVGKTVILVWNLQPVKLRGVESQGMILAAEDADGKLSLLGLDRELASGSVVS